jgi:hypothetical protein
MTLAVVWQFRAQGQNPEGPCAATYRCRSIACPGVALDLPETDSIRVQRGCQQRILERAQHQVRLEHQVCGHDVVVVERRVPWDAPDTPFGPQWTGRRLARLRHSAAGLRLYWPDRNTRWHLVADVPAATSVVAPVEAVDDPRRAFHG